MSRIINITRVKKFATPVLLPGGATAHYYISVVTNRLDQAGDLFVVNERKAPLSGDYTSVRAEFVQQRNALIAAHDSALSDLDVLIARLDVLESR